MKFSWLINGYINSKSIVAVDPPEGKSVLVVLVCIVWVVMVLVTIVVILAIVV